MFIPTETQVQVRNGEVIPEALYTLAREWVKAAEAAGVPVSGTVEEVRSAVPNGTLGFSPEDSAVIQGVNGNGAVLFARAFSEVTGCEWSASDRIISEELRNPVKYTATLRRGKSKGEKVEKVYTCLHRKSPRDTEKKDAPKKSRAKKSRAKK